MNVSAEVCHEHVEFRDIRKPLQGIEEAWRRQQWCKEFDKEFDTKAPVGHHVQMRAKAGYSRDYACIVQGRARCCNKRAPIISGLTQFKVTSQSQRFWVEGQGGT